MAVALGDPILTTQGVYYFPDVTRETSAAKIAQTGYPIFRNSSVPSMYALTYYDNTGKLVHSLARPELRSVIVDSSGAVLGFTVPDVIGMFKSINPAKYAVSEDPVAFGGGKRRRRTSGKVRRTRRACRR